MVDTGSKLVPRASLQTVGSGETGKRDPRDARVSDEECADVGQGYSGVLSGEGEEDENDEPKHDDDILERKTASWTDRQWA
jgi:hypothetical protein